MTVYAAFLRGVNVRGVNVGGVNLKMAAPADDAGPDETIARGPAAADVIYWQMP